MKTWILRLSVRGHAGRIVSMRWETSVQLSISSGVHAVVGISTIAVAMGAGVQMTSQNVTAD